MIKRTIEGVIRKQLQVFPVVVVTGPRQSGKTTLLRQMLPDYGYYNLEELTTKQLAATDPVGFLQSLDKPVILDEIQKAPDLLSQIQVMVDESGKMGQFVLTGSENLLLSDKIAQSLAGRVVNNVLLPLSYEELRREKLVVKPLESQILSGFYPRLYSTKIDYEDFYGEYIRTYVERDVRQIKNIGDLSQFERFLQLVAGRSGQLVNLSSLANDVGISHNTVEQWLSVLEASYVIFRLQPYYKNLGKRVIKSPKLYFYDVGLLTYLLGIATPDELRQHYAFGSIFENLVIAELIKQTYNRRLRVKPYFYRDSNGVELDLIMDGGVRILGMEIKAAQTFSTDFLKGLRQFAQLTTNQFSGVVVYRGEMEQKVEGFDLLSYESLGGVLRGEFGRQEGDKVTR